MNVFVFNCGSSSVKGQLVDLKLRAAVAGGRVERIGEAGAQLVTWQRTPSESRDESSTPAAAADAAIPAKIKARLAADRELSAWSINVSTAAGRVTLDGQVASEEHLARAMTLALETDGVVDVTANLKVEPAR